MPDEPDYGYKTIPTNMITVFADAGRGDANDPNLDGLIRSIDAIGLLHPITVYPDGEHWFCMAGARRLAAVRALGWELITANVRKRPDTQGAVAVTALENLDRKQLDPIDEATMCAQAIEVLGDIETVAKSINRTTTWVQARLNILGWPTDCIDALHGTSLSMSALQPLASIDNDHVRNFYLTEAIANGATARQTAAWAANWRSAGHETSSPTPPADINTSQPGSPAQPPTGYCLICRRQHQLNELSHLPMCTSCLSTIREAATHIDQTPTEPLEPSDAAI